jgi:hypothetical protein
LVNNQFEGQSFGVYQIWELVRIAILTASNDKKNLIISIPTNALPFWYIWKISHYFKIASYNEFAKKYCEKMLLLISITDITQQGYKILL